MKRQIDLQEQLQDELLALSFHGFEQCVLLLLKQMGYSEVDLMGRTHWRQFTHHGGLDMQARSRLGVTETPVILQLKQYKRPVSRRFVDELRGTMLRLGAGHGLIISTSTFSKVARTAALSELAPVRLIDGEELVALLKENGIGVHPKGKKGGKLDKRFWKKLRKQYPGKAAITSSPYSQKRGRPRQALMTHHQLTIQETLCFGEPTL